MARSYDVVGDIAIITVPESLEHRIYAIGQAVLSTNRKIKTICRKIGYCGGEFRLVSLEVIGGEKKKETSVKENGVHFFLHLEKVYYSVRQAAERRRIADIVQPGEDVLVMFSGVAPYPLVIAKHSKARKITGIEKNSIAHEYGMKSLQLNKKLKNIELMCGDVQKLLPGLNADVCFDRIIMPLPHRSYEFLQLALSRLRQGGFLHLYIMHDIKNLDGLTEWLKQELAALKRDGVLIQPVVCGHCSPGYHRVCVDCQIR